MQSRYGLSTDQQPWLALTHATTAISTDTSLKPVSHRECTCICYAAWLAAHLGCTMALNSRWEPSWCQVLSPTHSYGAVQQQSLGRTMALDSRWEPSGETASPVTESECPGRVRLMLSLRRSQAWISFSIPAVYTCMLEGLGSSMAVASTQGSRLLAGTEHSKQQQL